MYIKVSKVLVLGCISGVSERKHSVKTLFLSNSKCLKYGLNMKQLHRFYIKYQCYILLFLINILYDSFVLSVKYFIYLWCSLVLWDLVYLLTHTHTNTSTGMTVNMKSKQLREIIIPEDQQYVAVP